MTDQIRAMTIEELEGALAVLVDRYVASLSHAKPKPVHKVRIEASGDGVSVMYDRSAPDGMPTLVVQIVQPPRK
jgi:hypothetical protein